MSDRTRKLMQLTITQMGRKSGNKYRMTYDLPMNGATTEEAEYCALSFMRAINAQLDYSKSKMRLQFKESTP